MKNMLIIALLGYAAWWWYDNKWSYSDASLDIQAQAINKSMPRRLSVELTATSVAAKPGRIIVYNIEYFLPAKLLPPNAAESLQSDRVRSEAAKALCGDKVAREGLKRGVKIIYTFTAKDGEPITDIEFTAADCP